jgi:uncharacterized protein (DUF2267 family)
MTSAAFYRMVMETSGEKRREVTKRATAAVFHALRDRLTPREADQLKAQLPRDLKQVWEAGERADRGPLKLSRNEFFQRVKAEAQAGSTRDVRWMTLAVFATLKEQLSPGEAEDVYAQLPKDLKQLWAEAQLEAGGGQER